MTRTHKLIVAFACFAVAALLLFGCASTRPDCYVLPDGSYCCGEDCPSD